MRGIAFLCLLPPSSREQFKYLSFSSVPETWRQIVVILEVRIEDMEVE